MGSGLDIEVKPEAHLDQLVPEMSRAYPQIVDAWRQEGGPRPVITSGNDGHHMRRSRHYANQALDLRANNIEPAQAQAIRDRLGQGLGADYDVIFETFADPRRNHIHVEYDPD